MGSISMTGQCLRRPLFLEFARLGRGLNVADSAMIGNPLLASDGVFQGWFLYATVVLQV
jgi:hypothetical protein